VAIVATPGEPSRETLDVYSGAQEIEAPAVRVREVIVVGAATRPLGATDEPRTPRPARAPPPPSPAFRLVQRYDDDLFVLFRYRAREPRRLSRASLAATRVDDVEPKLLLTR
jgi:hypothetical protein